MASEVQVQIIYEPYIIIACLLSLNVMKYAKRSNLFQFKLIPPQKHFKSCVKIVVIKLSNDHYSTIST